MSLHARGRQVTVWILALLTAACVDTPDPTALPVSDVPAMAGLAGPRPWSWTAYASQECPPGSTSQNQSMSPVDTRGTVVLVGRSECRTDGGGSITDPVDFLVYELSGGTATVIDAATLSGNGVAVTLSFPGQGIAVGVEGDQMVHYDGAFSHGVLDCGGCSPRSMWGEDPQDLWIGATFGVFRWQNGVTTTELRPSNPVIFMGVSASGGSDPELVVAGGFELWERTNGAWTRIYSGPELAPDCTIDHPSLGLIGNIGAVAVHGTGEAWALGPGCTLRRDRSGVWQRATPLPARPEDAVALGPGQLLVAGQATWTGPGLWFTDDAGATWTAIENSAFEGFEPVQRAAFAFSVTSGARSVFLPGIHDFLWVGRVGGGPPQR